MFGFLFLGCGKQVTTTSDNGIPFPSKDVIFQLDDLSAASSSSLKTKAASRAQGLVTSAYAQAGIDLGYFEGFDPVLSTFRAETLTSIGSNEYTFVSTYGAGSSAIPFKGLVEQKAANYIVKVWGIRPGESSYRRWLYGDLINANRGSIIIDPYIMWTSTHDYPMTIKFAYDATTTGTKVCSGGARGSWSASNEVVGSTYFYCSENDNDSSNTIVTFKMYQNATNPATAISIEDMLYGKFNRDTERLQGRDWTDGYATRDSGLLYVDVTTYGTLSGTVPSNIDASALIFPVTPEAGFAAWPATSEFPSSPTF
ncbi:MAG: hypothetical protein HQ564_10670 [Candidatus Saganbacteria bacterium]|nr:hypothetical protein [Candidatus Saganbacteria bacterium]